MKTLIAFLFLANTSCTYIKREPSSIENPRDKLSFLSDSLKNSKYMIEHPDNAEIKIEAYRHNGTQAFDDDSLHNLHKENLEVVNVNFQKTYQPRGEFPSEVLNLAEISCVSLYLGSFIKTLNYNIKTVYGTQLQTLTKLIKDEGFLPPNKFKILISLRNANGVRQIALGIHPQKSPNEYETALFADRVENNCDSNKEAPRMFFEFIKSYYQLALNSLSD